MIALKRDEATPQAPIFVVRVSTEPFMPRLLAALFFIIVANIANPEIMLRDGWSVTPTTSSITP